MGDTVREVNYDSKWSAIFLGKESGTISLPPRVTPTLVMPLFGLLENL